MNSSRKFRVQAWFVRSGFQPHDRTGWCAIKANGSNKAGPFRKRPACGMSFRYALPIFFNAKSFIFITITSQSFNGSFGDCLNVPDTFAAILMIFFQGRHGAED
jgi:hypothetical protein